MDNLTDLQKILLRTLKESGVNFDLIRKFYGTIEGDESCSTHPFSLGMTIGTQTDNSSCHRNSGDDKLSAHSTTNGGSSSVQVCCESPRSLSSSKLDSVPDDTKQFKQHVDVECFDLSCASSNKVSSTTEGLSPHEGGLFDDLDEQAMVNRLLSLDPWQSSDVIKSFMNQHNISQKEAVDMTGLNQSHLSQHLNKGTPMKEQKRIILYRWFSQARQRVADQYKTGMKRARSHTEPCLDDDVITTKRHSSNRFKWGKASLGVLNNAFKVQPNPTKDARSALAKRCNKVELESRGLPSDQYGALAANYVTEMRVYNWFANRRKEDSFRNRLQMTRKGMDCQNYRSVAGCSSQFNSAEINNAANLKNEVAAKAYLNHHPGNANNCDVSLEQDRVSSQTVSLHTEHAKDGKIEKRPEESERLVTPSNVDNKCVTTAATLGHSQPTISNAQQTISDSPMIGEPLAPAEAYSTPVTTEHGEKLAPCYILSPTKTLFPPLQPTKPLPVNIAQEGLLPCVPQTLPYFRFTQFPFALGHDFGYVSPGNFAGQVQPYYFAPLGAGVGTTMQRENFHVAFNNTEGIQPCTTPLMQGMLTPRVPLLEPFQVAVDTLKPVQTQDNAQDQDTEKLPKAIFGVFRPILPSPLDAMQTPLIFPSIKESKDDQNRQTAPGLCSLGGSALTMQDSVPPPIVSEETFQLPHKNNMNEALDIVSPQSSSSNGEEFAKRFTKDSNTERVVLDSKNITGHHEETKYNAVTDAGTIHVTSEGINKPDGLTKCVNEIENLRRTVESI